MLGLCCLWAFFSCGEQGLLSSCSVLASHWYGFSCSGILALGPWALVVPASGLSSRGSWALEQRLSRWGAQAYFPRGMWNLPSCSVTQSCPTFWDPMDCSWLGFPVFAISQSLLKFMSIEAVMPSNHLILRWPLLLLPSILPNIRTFSMSLTTSGGQSIGTSVSASLFPMHFRTEFLYDWLVWSPCSPRDAQESSPTSQFKSINSLMFSLLYASTLTSIHDYWNKTIALTRWTFVGKIISLLLICCLGWS